MSLSSLIFASIFQLYSLDFSAVPMDRAIAKAPNSFATFITAEMSTGNINAYSFDPFPFKAGVKAAMFRADWKAGARLHVAYDSPFYGETKARIFEGHLFYYAPIYGKAEIRAGVIQNPLFAEENGPMNLRGHGLDFRGKNFFNYSGTYYDIVIDFVPASGVGIQLIEKFPFGLVLDTGYMIDEKAFFLRTAYQIKAGKLFIRPEINFISFNPDKITFERNEAYTTGASQLTFKTEAMSIFEFKTLALIGNLGAEIKMGFFNFRKGDIEVQDNSLLKGSYLRAGAFYTLKLSEKGLIKEITIRDDISIRGADQKNSGDFMNSVTGIVNFFGVINGFFSWSVRIPENPDSSSKSYVAFGANYSTSF